MPANVLVTVLLTTKGEVRKANLPLSEEHTLSIEAVQKYFRKKEVPEEIAKYNHNDKQFTLIGYKKGKSGTENKHELPAPYTKHPRFGDILIFQTNEDDNWKDDALPMTPEQWKDFVENCNDDDKEDEDDSEEDEETDAEEEEEEEFEEEENEDDALESEEELENEHAEEPEDDIEPEPPVVRRRKVTTLTIKGDISSMKEEVDLNLPASSHPIRSGCLKQFGFLEKEFEKQEVITLEAAIFRSAFDQAKRHCVPRNWKSQPFQDLYKQTAQQILWNIHPQSPVKNPRLIQRIKDKEFSLDALGSMSAYDMYPEHWKELADKQLIREQKILEGNKSRATDQFKCRRCGKQECTFYEMQTRSADEPMTIFITCINCGKRWRQ